MKNDETFRSNVEKAIRWGPVLNNSEIGVTAKDGIITLTGCILCFS